jgi:thiol:disulfide interchange protein DsbD
VKCILGLPILYFSYIYYLKGLETASVSTNVAHAMLFGAIAIGLAVFIGGLQQIGETRQPGLLVRQTLGIILLIAGIYFLYNGLGQSGILLTAAPRNLERIAASVSSPSPSDIRDTNPAVEVHGNLQWLRDFYSAKTRAALENKPLFVDFYAAWCANCKAFSRLTLVDPHLNTALQQVVLVKLYDTDAIFRTFQQDQQFPELGGLGGYPFLPLFAIYSSQGTLLWKGQDYGAVQTMVAQLEQAKYTAR